MMKLMSLKVLTTRKLPDVAAAQAAIGPCDAGVFSERELKSDQTNLQAGQSYSALLISALNRLRRPMP